MVGQVINGHTITYNETMVWNFDSIEDSRFTYSGNTFASSVPDVAADPAHDTTAFGAAEPVGDIGVGGITAGDALFSVKPGFEITSFSFDLGSLDAYNTLTFLHNGVAVSGGTFTGQMLTDPDDPVGDQNSTANNRRYYFSFSAADGINGVLFSSSQPAFEFDNIAATLSAVPEPATWSMMILGFGFVGFMMRSNRQKVAAVAA